MTNKKDSFKQRTLDFFGLEETRGVPQDGFSDASGEYPKRDYFYGPGISKTARGENINELWHSGGDFGVDASVADQIPSQYPYNQVQETQSGHSIEIDDTPGGERILIKHRTGSGIELRADGSLVFSTKNKKVSLTGGDDVVIVEGQADLVYKGNLNLRVDGDFNLDVGGNWNINVAGDKFEEVKGRNNFIVDRDQQQTIRGSRDTRIGFVDNMTIGDQQIINTLNDVRYFVNGKFDIASSDTMRISSERKITVATEKFGVTAENLSMIGKKGSIGGDDIEYYGSIFKGTKGGHFGSSNANFYGKLIGSAQQADYAIKSGASGHAVKADWASVSTYSTSSVNAGNSDLSGITSALIAAQIAALGFNGLLGPVVPEIKVPYPTPVQPENPKSYPPLGLFVDLVLQTTGAGIYKLDFAEDYNDTIRLIDDYKGAFIKNPNIHEVRSKLRDEQWRNNGELIDKLISESRLSKSWTRTNPPNIGRTANKNGTIRFGETLIGNNPSDNRSKRFKTK